MSITIIIFILLGALIILFATRALGRIAKIITKIFLLLILTLVILSLLVYNDMQNLRKGFKHSNNTILLYQDQTLHSAITLKPRNTTQVSSQDFVFYTQEEITGMQEKLNNQEYQALLNKNYKLIIMKPGLLDKPYNISLGAELDQKDLLEIITSQQAFTALANKTSQAYNTSIQELEHGIEQQYGSETRLKGYLFAALLTNYLQQQKPGELVKNIKNKDTQILPDTISFKIIRYLPWIS